MPGGLTQLAVSESESDAEDGGFTVEAILAKRIVKGKPTYKVKWHGYGADEATWEPLANCVGCEGLISAFEEASVASPPLGSPPKPVRSAAKRKAAEPKAAKKEKAPAVKKEKAVKAEPAAAKGAGTHKYKDADGRLDRKKNGYYDIKNTWASSGQTQQAHSGLNTNLDGALKAMPKKFKKVDGVSTHAMHTFRRVIDPL
jgi:hypothetical protein